MPVVDSTIGGQDANSYATVAQIDDYFDGSPHGAAWAALDADAKAWVVINATALIDTLCFTGEAATETQALAWPRAGMLNKNGFTIPDNAIPRPLVVAVAELAKIVAGSDRVAPNEIAELGLTRLKAGPVELGFASPADGDNGGAAAVPAAVVALLPKSWLCPEQEEDTREAWFMAL